MKGLFYSIFLFSLFTSAVQARLANELLTKASFCKQLLEISNDQAKLDFINIHLSELINSPSALNKVDPLMKNFLMNTYQNDGLFKANLFNKLGDVQDSQQCRDILTNAFNSSNQLANMLEEFDKDLELTIADELKKYGKSNNQNKSEKKSCENETRCDAIPPIINSGSGLNQVIKAAATGFPLVLVGEYNETCACSKSKDVGGINNPKEKKLAQDFLVRELMRKKLYKLIDFNEKKLLADSLNNKSIQMSNLSCDKEGLEQSLNKECKGKKLNLKLLSESLAKIIQDNPKISLNENLKSLAQMESAFAASSIKIKSCEKMTYENYAFLAQKDTRMHLNKFLNLYKVLFQEIPEKIDDEDGHHPDLYVNAFLKTIKNPNKKAELLLLLDLDPNASEEDIKTKFEVVHEKYSSMLPFKTVLNSPELLRKQLLEDKIQDFSTFLKKGLDESLGPKNCQNIMQEIAAVACVDSDKIDFTKYHIDLDQLVSMYPEAMTPELLTGLCLLRRKSKDGNKVGVTYQSLPKESQPDIVKFIPDPSSTHTKIDPIMEIYGAKFCSYNSQLGQNVEQEHETIQDIVENPTYYSSFMSVDDFLPNNSSVSFFTEKSKSPQNDNSRDHFARTNRNSQTYQANVNFNSNQTKRLDFTDYSSSLNTRSIQGQTKSTISSITNPSDESTMNQVVNQYRELDDNDDDYFAKRKELLKQLYASSENTTTSSNLSSNDYLTKIKELEEKLQQNENLLKQAGGGASHKNNESINSNQQNLVTASSVSQLSGANESKVSTNVNEPSFTNTNSSKSSVISGGDVSVGENSSNAILASKNARSDGLYLSLSNSDFENVKFIKNVEGQIKELAQTNMDSLVQLLEKGQLVVEIDGKKINIKNDDLNKILDPITLNMIQMKLSEKKSSSLIKNKKQQVESEVKQIKSQLYNTLLQLSKRLKSEGKI